MLDSLLRLPLFNLLEKSWLSNWWEAGTVGRYPIGETIAREGDISKYLLYVQAGGIRILRHGSDGREYTLGVGATGDLLSDYTLLKPHRMAATLRVTEPAQIRFLSLDELNSHLRNDLAISDGLRQWVKLNHLVRFLNNGAWQGFMSASSFLPMFDKLRTLTIPAGSTIQADGLFDDCWFHITHGEAMLLGRNADHNTVLGSRDSFGALALRNEVPLTAIARTELRCHFLNRAHFLTNRIETEVSPLALAGTWSSEDSSFQQSVKWNVLPKHEAFRWIAQRDEVDCGVTALTMVLRHIGCEYQIDDIRRHVALTDQGCSMLSLKNAAQVLGYRASAVKISVNQLSGVSLPAIAHQPDGHFVVIFQYENRYLTIADPSTGMRLMSEYEFSNQWTNNLLLIHSAK